jgi:AraC-like DNA-binding protein
MTARAKRLTNGARTQQSRRVSTTIGGHNVRAFVNALERLGYNVESLLAQAMVNRSDLDDPDARIRCDAMPAIVRAAMTERPLSNLGARMAAETPIGAFPLIDYLVVTSETVAAGLAQLARYFRLADAGYTMDVRDDGDPVRVVLENAQGAFVVTYGLGLIVVHLRREVEGPLTIDAAHFTDRPDDPAELEQMWGCPVRVNSDWDGLEFPRASWEMRLRRRDPALRGVLEQHAAQIVSRIPEGDDFAVRVRQALTAHIGKADVPMQAVAKELAVSCRSLQRRLAEAGLSYQKLLDAGRRDAAREYLDNPGLSVGEVGYLLGYSEPAAFHRAFKRWSGVTPQAYRERRRASQEEQAPASD